MPYDGSDNSIPRIAVREVNGQIVCIIDSKTKKRYGPVLLSNRKQGLHLFSVGYCLTSWTANYCRHKTDYMGILRDLLHNFHPNFMTKLLVNAKFRKERTYFHLNWRNYLNEMVDAYKNLQAAYNSGKKRDFYLGDLEEYLNFAGALQHVLPCNVAFSNDARDPDGGADAKNAIEGIYGLYLKGEKERRTQINTNISKIIDLKVIEAFFNNGFNANNMWCLAYIIIQIVELQNLYQAQVRDYTPSYLNQSGYDQVREDVFNLVPFGEHPPTSNKQLFPNAYADAVAKICSQRELVMRLLAKKQHEGIFSRIDQERF